MKSDKNSRRAMLQTIVASALLTATPFSALEAAMKDGKPRTLALADGSTLTIKKVGNKKFRATRQEGAKVDKNPTGSFTGKSGEVVVVEQGKVMNVTGMETT